MPTGRVASRRPLLCAAFAILLFVLSTAAGWTETIVVPIDAPTVQGALDRLRLQSHGPLDTVIVQSGSYPEAVEVRRRVVLRGADHAELPRIRSLRVTDAGWGPLVVENLRVEGPARLAIGGSALDVRFTGCVIDSGFVDEANASEGWRMWLTRCSIAGATSLGAAGLVVESCRFAGPLAFLSGKSSFHVSRSELIGSPGAGAGISAVGSDNDVRIVDNLVRGFEVGVRIRGMSHAVELRGNRIEACGLQAAFVEAMGDVAIEANQIRDCGDGVTARGHNAVSIRSNRILGCAGVGLALRGEPVVVEGNIVGRCLGDGVRVERAMGLRMRANTLYGNGGAGASLALFEAGVVDHNIFHGNLGPAIDPPNESEILALSCNDGFANGSQEIGAADLSVDPGFCDLASDDVHLRADSPLLSAGTCGLIGALGAGCADTVATPVLVQRFDAVRVPEGVLVRWGIADAAWTEAPVLQSATSRDGPWRGVPVRAMEPDGTVFAMDVEASPERATWYRLVCCGNGSDRVLAGPLEVPARVTSFRLGALPSPSTGPVRIEMNLPRAAAVSLEVFDAAGRRLRTLANGTWPVGAHWLEWNGRDRAPGPGVYLIRLRHPEGSQMRRVVLID